MADPREAKKQDVETLKRRGRRRLVGATALVLAAVIVLPMVFDAEPRRVPPVSVRIPSEEDPAFTPKVVPTAPVAAPDAAGKSRPEPKTEPKAAPKPQPKGEPKPEPKAETTPEPKAAPKVEPAAPSDAERRRAEAALAGVQYIVPVGAFSTAEKLAEVTEKLGAAKIPYYTEQVAIAKGTATRVRAGPFPTSEAAGLALQKLQGLGFKPGKVTTRS